MFFCFCFFSDFPTQHHTSYVDSQQLHVSTPCTFQLDQEKTSYCSHLEFAAFPFTLTPHHVVVIGQEPDHPLVLVLWLEDDGDKLVLCE